LASRSRNSVFLSGWEYNRVLQPDPTIPRNSALPASILWNGSHQLWMFETVFCTKESFENEARATDSLGWVNGTVLRDLADEGILRTVDWQRLPAETKDRLHRARNEVLRDVSEDQIRAAVAEGNAAVLELTKTAILEPILDLHECFESGAPNSISTWIAEGGQPIREPGAPSRASGLSSLRMRGLQVCRPPGSGVSLQSRHRERDVQITVERPMIPQLLAGDGEFSGPEGFEPYLARLTVVKDAYAETNAQLHADWTANKDNLFRLRDAASRHLWPDLHSHWLPLLASQDADAGKEFDRWVRSAERIAPIARYLDSKPTKIVAGSFGPYALALALARLGMPWAEAFATSGVAAFGGSALRRHFDQVKHLAMFFQETRTTQQAPEAGH
jgi:hypothetical protein